jgi:hypothetical protein
MDHLLIGAVDCIFMDGFGARVDVLAAGVPERVDDAHRLSLAGVGAETVRLVDSVEVVLLGLHFVVEAMYVICQRA